MILPTPFVTLPCWFAFRCYTRLPHGYGYRLRAVYLWRLTFTQRLTTFLRLLITVITCQPVRCRAPLCTLGRAFPHCRLLLPQPPVIRHYSLLRSCTTVIYVRCSPRCSLRVRSSLPPRCHLPPAFYFDSPLPLRPGLPPTRLTPVDSYDSCSALTFPVVVIVVVG